MAQGSLRAGHGTPGKTKVRFLGFEPSGGELRARLEVAIPGDRPFAACVSLSNSGVVYELHVSNGPEYDASTTGDPELDALVCELAQEELVRARSAVVVARFDRQRL